MESLHFTVEEMASPSGDSDLLGVAEVDCVRHPEEVEATRSSSGEGCAVGEGKTGEKLM